MTHAEFLAAAQAECASHGVAFTPRARAIMTNLYRAIAEDARERRMDDIAAASAVAWAMEAGPTNGGER